MSSGLTLSSKPSSCNLFIKKSLSYFDFKLLTSVFLLIENARCIKSLKSAKLEILYPSCGISLHNALSTFGAGVKHSF